MSGISTLEEHLSIVHPDTREKVRREINRTHARAQAREGRARVEKYLRWASDGGLASVTESERAKVAADLGYESEEKMFQAIGQELLSPIEFVARRRVLDDRYHDIDATAVRAPSAVQVDSAQSQDTTQECSVCGPSPDNVQLQATRDGGVLTFHRSGCQVLRNVANPIGAHWVLGPAQPKWRVSWAVGWRADVAGLEAGLRGTVEKAGSHVANAEVIPTKTFPLLVVAVEVLSVRHMLSVAELIESDPRVRGLRRYWRPAYESGSVF